MLFDKFFFRGDRDFFVLSGRFLPPPGAVDGPVDSKPSWSSTAVMNGEAVRLGGLVLMRD